MKFLDLFSGIGGFRLGMEMAGHKCVGHCEIDKYANKAYCKMYEVGKDEWFSDDIQRVQPGEIPSADVWCFGFPCQDISIAGKQRGLEGARSGLFYKVIDLIKGQEEKNKPSILLIENVKNLFSINDGWDFAKVLFELDEAGYDAEWQLINSSWFVPQNRERIYIVASLRGRSSRKVFPVAGNSKKTIKKLIDGPQACRIHDVEGLSCSLQSTAGGLGAKTGLYAVNISRMSYPRYTNIANCLMARDYKGIGNQEMTAVQVRAILSPDRNNKRQNGRRLKNPGEPMFTLTTQDRHGVMINCLNTKSSDGYQTQQQDRIYDTSGHMAAITSQLNGRFNVLVSEATRQGYSIANEGDSINLAVPGSKTRRGRVGKSKANTLDTSCNQGTLTEGRIRRLTPKECFRLQGFPDEYFDKAKLAGLSDTQLYKCAGNSVTVNVVNEIAERLLN